MTDQPTHITRTLEVLECAQPGTQDIMSVGEAARLAEIMKAIADPVRLRLLTWVADAPDTTACACHLPAVLGISQPTLSHHLKRLVDAGLLHREQRGRWAHYRLAQDGLREIEALVASLRAAQR